MKTIAIAIVMAAAAICSKTNAQIGLGLSNQAALRSSAKFRTDIPQQTLRRGNETVERGRGKVRQTSERVRVRRSDDRPTNSRTAVRVRNSASVESDRTQRNGGDLDFRQGRNVRVRNSEMNERRTRRSSKKSLNTKVQSEANLQSRVRTN